MVLLPDERAWGALTFAKRFQTELARHRTAPLVSCGIAESSGLESADDARPPGRPRALRGQAQRPQDRRLLGRAQHRAGRSGRGDRGAPPPAALATALAQAVDAKDAGTRNHCETVSALCVLIGQALGLSRRAGRAAPARRAAARRRQDRHRRRRARKAGRARSRRAGRDELPRPDWATRSSRRPASRRRPNGSSGTTSTSTAAATPKASAARRFRSSRASSRSPTRSRR